MKLRQFVQKVKQLAEEHPTSQWPKVAAQANQLRGMTDSYHYINNVSCEMKASLFRVYMTSLGLSAQLSPSVDCMLHSHLTGIEFCLVHLHNDF